MDNKNNISSSFSLLALSSLGVVFGDIGTSPLYTLKTVLDATGGDTTQTIYGIVSILIWTLIIITAIKYAGFAMKIDNDGEGGILALMALLGVKRKKRPLIVAAGLFGAALIYGDGAITPAISVLSSLEGLELITPDLQAYVLPSAVLILFFLFILQPLGTAKIGKAFGPIMAIWFIVMALLGIRGIIQYPKILMALNPWYAMDYLLHSDGKGFLVLGGVFLCVTGAEALYADMGHFGAKPIRLAWYGLVLPSLVINYAGQGAIVLAGAATDGNIFYRLCPPNLLVPMVILSTIATIIASQSIITGAFSMTRQAIQLGWMPRLHVKQTSAEGYGQIYVGTVNWLLMIITICLTLIFQKSDNLAGAYGIAVSATMLMTSVLLFIAMKEIWGWSVWKSGLIAGFFIIIDISFFSSNLLKVFDGGYVPLILAIIIYTIMYIWHKGVEAVSADLNSNSQTIESFQQELILKHTIRVPGTGVFLSRVANGVPRIMQWYVNHCGCLHENVIIINIITLSTPWVTPAEHIHWIKNTEGFWSVEVKIGFMDVPDLPMVIQQLAQEGCDAAYQNVVYFAGLDKVLSAPKGQGLPKPIVKIFAVMTRNCYRITDYLKVPADQMVELGRQTRI